MTAGVRHADKVLLGLCGRPLATALNAGLVHGASGTNFLAPRQCAIPARHHSADWGAKGKHKEANRQTGASSRLELKWLELKWPQSQWHGSQLKRAGECRAFGGSTPNTSSRSCRLPLSATPVSVSRDRGPTSITNVFSKSLD